MAFRSFLLAATAVFVAAPASAAVFNFNFERPSNASPSTVTQQTFTFDSTPAQTPVVTINAAARVFDGSLQNLTNLSQLNPSPFPSVVWTTAGLGIPGGANNQLDTNGATRRETLLLTSNQVLTLSAAKFSWTDVNDTVKIYGVGENGALSTLAAGNIRTGFGPATVVSPTAGNSNANFATISFNPSLAPFQSYLFTTELNGSDGTGGQGYFLSSLTASVAVPEPATWAMMIGGFGIAGAAARRARRTTAVLA